jgi:hypothetical protein
MENIPLTDSKVRQALGLDTRIIKYSELKNYATIEDLLPNVGNFFILLLEEDMNKGHWTCMMKTPKEYYYFNSYGKKYDADLSVIPMCIRRILGQDQKEITRLLGDNECKYNTVKFQGDKSQVCGRFCVLTITYVCMLGFSPDEFVKFLEKEKEETNKSYDTIVAEFVPI